MIIKCGNYSCIAPYGCVYIPKNCDDGKYCTSDRCDLLSGQCVHTPLNCTPISKCYSSECIESAKGCVQKPLLKCTQPMDLCSAVECSPSDLTCSSTVPRKCFPSHPCSTSTCHPVAGKKRKHIFLLDINCSHLYKKDVLRPQCSATT